LPITRPSTLTRLAVHSLEDLPTEQPEGLEVASIPKRVDARDVLIGKRPPPPKQPEQEDGEDDDNGG